MDNLEEKLNSILSDPNMMQKIQAMAQSLGQSPQQETNPTSSTPQIDPNLLLKVSRLAGQTGIDDQQQALLRALTPYISQGKVTKLEKAMRAAKMARLASRFLGSGGLQLLTGR